MTCTLLRTAGQSSCYRCMVVRNSGKAYQYLVSSSMSPHGKFHDRSLLFGTVTVIDDASNSFAVTFNSDKIRDATQTKSIPQNFQVAKCKSSTISTAIACSPVYFRVLHYYSFHQACCDTERGQCTIERSRCPIYISGYFKYIREFSASQYRK